MENNNTPVPKAGSNEYLQELHSHVMDEIQAEWNFRGDFHKSRYSILRGIRSSQISALVMFLIKEGVIRGELK